MVEQQLPRHVRAHPDPNMRGASGDVTTDRAEVALLYLLARDHVVPGAIEELADELDGAARWSFDNGWLAQWAIDLADRLDSTTDRGGPAVERDTNGEPFVRPGGSDAPKLRCRECGAGNPDHRRDLKDDGGLRQVCWNCRSRLPDLPVEVDADFDDFVDPDDGREPCGVENGRLVCRRPAGHDGPHGAEGVA